MTNANSLGSSVPAICQKTLEESRQNQEGDKRFVVVFCGLLVFILSLVSALNYVVDPSGYFQTGLFKPVLQLTRRLKVEGLETAGQDATGLILGSSRVLKIEPSYIAQFDQASYYNAGVNYGKPEDFFAISQYYREIHGTLPRKLWIGLDVVAFHDDLLPDSELLETPKLSKYLSKDLLATQRSCISKLLSLQEAKLSVRSIRHALSKAKSNDEQYFRADGVIVYRDRERSIADHSYNFQQAYEYNEAEYKLLFQKYDHLNETRWRLLVELIELAQQDKCEVHLFITTDHPRLANALSCIDNYTKRTKELDQRLQELSDRLNVHYLNLQSIETFEGDPEQFVDAIHPLEPNTRRMVRCMIQDETARANHAVQ